MENENIIICENCYEENQSNRTICKNCGAKLYHNEESKSSSEKKKVSKKEKYIDNEDINTEDDTTNKVAFKFLIVINIMKLLGYGASIIGFIVWLNLEETGSAFLCLILGAIGTWLSTLIFEAIAEGLNLLQKIVDKK